MMGVLRSIRLRLTLWYVVVLAVVLAAFSAGIYLTLRHNLTSNLNASLENRTGVLLEVVAYEDGRPTLAGLVSPVDPDEHFVRVYDLDGVVTFDNSESAEVPAMDSEAVRRALSGQSSTGHVNVGDDTLRVRVVPITENGEIAGVLEVGLSEDDLSDTLGTLLLILAILTPRRSPWPASAASSWPAAPSRPSINSLGWRDGFRLKT